MKSIKRPFFCLLIIISFSNCGSKRLIIDEASATALSTHNYFKTDTNKDLKLDFYKSKNNTENSPLLIYVHGGGFSGGARNEKFIQDYCIKIVKQGFAVASISYRLSMKKYGFGCNTKAALKIEAFNKAAEDISYATKHILENNKKFKIDTTNIILVGSSAGAEAVLHLAYVFENNILPSDFKFGGVISMAGAITTLEKITEDRAIPTQLFHGVKDKLVPYNKAPHHYCKKGKKGYLPLFGSKAIADKLKTLNKNYYLYTVENGNHSWNYKPMLLNIKEMIDFINTQILEKKTTQTEVIKKESNHN